MTTQTAPKKPQAPTPAPAKLKPLPFAFPFLRKGRGMSDSSAQFADERELYRLLAQREPSGAYLVSRKGMWHGGIHVTEAGAGQSLDLDAGLRCIADGVLIAFRANKRYLISDSSMPTGAPFEALYSTGFALVRHTMEFPPGTKLTFYSLYMHLMSCDDYANFPKRDKPSYWTRQWTVTQYARDKPGPSRTGQMADGQQGLRVRKRPKHGDIIGIVPQGASVTIGKKEGDWGQVTDLHGASLYPPNAGGYVEPALAIGCWVYVGQENGGPVVEEVILDSMFDRVIVTTDQMGSEDDAQGGGGGGGIPVKAGDLIGHLGRYDSVSQCTSGTRMAHIEVFCDDSIESFLEQGRTWIERNGQQKEAWAGLGLPSEPTILRIEPGTVLYQQQDKKFVPGAEPQSRKVDRVQVYSLAELARDPKRRVAEPKPNPDPGHPVSWWHVDAVNALGQPIDGWVRDANFAGGRVTREFAQNWVDFECVSDAHDPAHTIFATTQKWLDYVTGANVADVAARTNLSPLMLGVYDALFEKGDGKQAADELCTLTHTERDGHPWLMQAASRLIVKHESEWANPSKWTQLIAELEKQTGAKPQHEEERKRIEKLAWWEEVKAGIPSFPLPGVHHLNPLALVENFASEKLVCMHCGSIITLTKDFLKKIAPNAGEDIVHALIRASVGIFPKYGVSTCRQIKHFLAQAKHETQRFSEFRESLYYKRYTGESLYRMAPTAINEGFARKGMEFQTKAEKYAWIQKHLIANDAAYGEHCFGANEQPGKDFRGRGMLHLTHYETYKRCAHAIDCPIDSQPELVESDPFVIIETALWFWRDRKIGRIADNPAALGDEGVKKVTRPINAGYMGLSERQRFKREISIVFDQCYSSGCSDD